MGTLDRLRELYQDRHLSDALDLYRERLDHLDPEWHLLGSLITAHLGRWREAQTAINLARERNPAGLLAVRILYAAGNTLRATGGYLEALDCIDACLDLLPSHPELGAVVRGSALYNRALALSYIPSRRHEAIVSYQQAAMEFRKEKLHQHLVDALLNLSWMLAEDGRLDEADAGLDEAEPLIQSAQIRWHLHVNRAHLLLRSGRRTEAMQMCEQAVAEAESPDAVRCWAMILMTEIAADLTLWQEMETFADVAIRLASTSSKVDMDSRCLLIASKTLTRGRKLKLERGA